MFIRFKFNKEVNMKYLCGFVLGLSILFSQSLQAGVLVLSDKLQMEYASPELLSHTENTLIFKYKSWSFVHEVVDPKNIYPKIDLTGIDRIFLHAIFERSQMNKLPGWLKALAKEQADQFGVKSDNVKHLKVGDAEIIGVYDKKKRSANVYLFEKLKIHHFVIYGSEQNFQDLINGIGVR